MVSSPIEQILSPPSIYLNSSIQSGGALATSRIANKPICNIFLHTHESFFNFLTSEIARVVIGSLAPWHSASRASANLLNSQNTRRLTLTHWYAIYLYCPRHVSETPGTKYEVHPASRKYLLEVSSSIFTTRYYEVSYFVDTRCDMDCRSV